ncbi:MAG: fibronectin type III domain-containing protein, partial [Thermoguttaceae bacterium]|nr:fibronectin type III domain-containing protein [Thermoguttaceae bacterium]
MATASERNGVITATVAPEDAEYEIIWKRLDGDASSSLGHTGSLSYERNSDDGTLGHKVALSITGKRGSQGSNAEFIFTPASPSTPTLTGAYDASTVSINLKRGTLAEATSYVLKYTIDGGEENSVPPTDVDVFSIQNDDLQRDATYKFWIIASNDGGSAVSEPLTITIDPVPSTPTISSAQYYGELNAVVGEIKIIWNSIEHADGYKLYSSVNNGDLIQIYDGATCEFTYGSSYVANGSKYSFTVVAYSELGESNASAPAVVAPLLAVASEKNDVINATITPSSADYDYEWSYLDGETSVPLNVNGLRYERNVSDGTLGRTVTLTITGKGKSSGSGATFTFAPGAPTAPEFSAEYDKSSRAISINWIPKDNVYEYELSYTIGNSIDVHIVDDPVNGAYVLTDVQPGTAYSFTLKATNASGTQGSTHLVTTPITTEAILESAYSGDPKSTTGVVTLSWTAVDYVDEYRVYVTIEGVAQSEAIYTGVGQTTTYEVQNGKTYDFVVDSCSEINTAHSNAITVKPLLATAVEDNGVITATILPEDAEYEIIWSRLDGDEGRLDESDLSYERNLDDGTLGRKVALTITGKGESNGSSAEFVFTPAAPSTPTLTGEYDASSISINLTRVTLTEATSYALKYTINDGEELSVPLTDTDVFSIQSNDLQRGAIY